MRKSTVWLTVLFASISSLVVTSQAFALELGSIQVRSYLNEPLVATIPVQVANIQERNSLATTLAPDTEYVARGLQPVGGSDDLVIQVVEGRALEEMLIELRSLSDIEEPFVNLVLQLSWDGGSMVKEFTILLDPQPVVASEELEERVTEEPVAEGLAPVMPITEESAFSESEAANEIEDPALQMLAQELAKESQTQISTGKPQVIIRKVSPDAYLAGETGAAAATSSYTPTYSSGDSYSAERSDATAASTFTGDSYGPVKAGETLWRIATNVRPSSAVPMANVMAAIFQANPTAFEGSYETLKKGAVLSIPSADSMRGASPIASSTAAVEEIEAEQTAIKQKAEAADTTSASDGDAAAAPSIWGEAKRKPAVDSKALESKGGLITKSAKVPEEIAQAGEKPAPATEAAANETATKSDEEQAAAAPTASKDIANAAEAEKIAGQVDYSGTQNPMDGSEKASESVETSEAAQPAALTEEALGEVEDTSELTTESEAGEVAEADAAADAQDTSAGGQDNTSLLALVVLLVLLLTYWWYRRRRQQGTEPSQEVYVAPDAGLDAEPTAVAPAEAEYADMGTSSELAANGVDANSESTSDSNELEAASTADPLEQANTYLSYGLYESAAESLNGGISAEPENAALRMKLLETHEAAGNPEQFEAAVKDWEANGPEISDSEREQVFAIANRLAPGLSLFAAAETTQEADEAAASTSLETDEEANTAVEEPAAEELPLPDFDLETQPVNAEAESVALSLDTEDLQAAASSSDEEITEDLELPDLDLDIADIPTDSEPAPDVGATDSEQESINFELDDISLDLAETAAEAEAAVESKEPAAFSLDDSELELALEEPAQESPSEGAEAEATEPDEAEYTVKLDLAQAYIDMGEHDLSKGLLDEVMSGGNPEQQAAAQALLDQLDS